MISKTLSKSHCRIINANEISSVNFKITTKTLNIKEDVKARADCQIGRWSTGNDVIGTGTDNIGTGTDGYCSLFSAVEAIQPYHVVEAFNYDRLFQVVSGQTAWFELDFEFALWWIHNLPQLA